MKRSLTIGCLATLVVAASPVRRAEPPMIFSVAAAEAEGRSFPRGSAPNNVPSMFSSTQAGTSERTCVSTSGPHNSLVTQVRAGDFVVGGQITALASGSGRKIWWTPMHGPAERYGGTLLVRAARIGNTMDTLRITRTGTAYPLGGPKTLVTLRSTARADAFYPSRIRLARPGAWILVATSGSDWGCLIINETG